MPLLSRHTFSSADGLDCSFCGRCEDVHRPSAFASESHTGDKLEVLRRGNGHRPDLPIGAGRSAPSGNRYGWRLCASWATVRRCGLDRRYPRDAVRALG
jgi:hypothetical protein